VQWLKKFRGAIGMGVTWAVAWAVAGLAIGVASVLTPALPWDAFFSVFDAPLPALAVPGFFAGVFFSLVLAVAERRQSLGQLTAKRFATWGAVGGVLLMAFPFVLVGLGLASTEGSTLSTWRILATLGLPFVGLSVLSAAATLRVARAAEARALPQTTRERGRVGP
jgi:ABC-type dipeptide/oligopeptide/nickel transport system permease component